MIIKIDNPVLIPEILKLAVKDDKFKIDSLRSMLNDALTRKDSLILIEKKDDVVRGFLFATIEFFQGEDSVFIQGCYVEQDAPQAGHELLAHVRNWGSNLGKEFIYFMTQRESGAWEKKYKFKVVSHVLKRRV